MGGNRQVLMVDLSGNKKAVLGYASWQQVSITAIAVISGTIVFSLVKALLQTIGLGSGATVTTGIVFFLIVAAPLIYIAFRKVYDPETNTFLYYQITQMRINRRYKQYELGTYLNLKTNHRPVNSRFSYAVYRDLD